MPDNQRIVEATKRKARGFAPKAIQVLAAVMNNTKNPPRVRMDAADKILKYSVPAAAKEIITNGNVTHEHNIGIVLLDYDDKNRPLLPNGKVLELESEDVKSVIHDDIGGEGTVSSDVMSSDVSDVG